MSGNPQLDDETLQRLLDGDLSVTEGRRARQVLASSPADATRYQQLEHLQRLVRRAADDMVGELDADAMFRNIEAGIAKDQPRLVEQVKAWLSEFFEHRSQVWMPMAGAGVVTAAVLLTIYQPGPSGGEGVENAPAVAVTGEPAALPTPAEPAPSSSIVQVDFGSNSGTVFEISLAGGKSTPVVWINDDSGGGL